MRTRWTPSIARPPKRPKARSTTRSSTRKPRSGAAASRSSGFPWIASWECFARPECPRFRAASSMLRVRRIRRSDLSRVASLVRALAAAVDDPAPRLSKAALETVLFGPRAWAEGHVAIDGSTIVGYAVVSRSFEPHTAKRQLRIADL